MDKLKKSTPPDDNALPKRPAPIYWVKVSKEELSWADWISTSVKKRLTQSVNIVVGVMGDRPVAAEINESWLNLLQWKVTQRTESLLGPAFFKKETASIFSSLINNVGKHAKITGKALRKAELISSIRKKNPPLSAEDLQSLAQDFTEGERARLTIYWNDRMAKEDLLTYSLPENAFETSVRETLESQNEKIRKQEGLLSFLQNLEFWAYETVEEFHAAILDASHRKRSDIQPLGDVYEWGKAMNKDWRDYPFIVQFAVGTNAFIKSPYSHREETCLMLESTTAEEYAEIHKRRGITDWISAVKRTMADIREGRDQIVEPKASDR